MFRRNRCPIRLLSTPSRFQVPPGIRVSPEISQAIRENKPVVSLESTIITHGFPYPANLDMAQAVERKIRDNGCIPATCAFIRGVPYVGLERLQIEHLAELKHANKVSRRDIGATMAHKLDGGTTIAGTMILSHMAGIDVFATGGLGGVHHDGHVSMDVSADLTELSRTPVAVVCSGPKRILDIPRTMEFLETQGVFVGTYNDDGRENVEVPGFFCRSSGVRSPYTFSSWKEMAAIAYNHNKVMGLSSGTLVCVPPPKESAMDSHFIDEIIFRATQEAKAQGVSGKEVTPFLLQKIAAATNGESVECNKQFVINNAESACHIAKEMCQMKAEGGEYRLPSTDLKPLKTKAQGGKNRESSNKSKINKGTTSRVDTVFFGLVALDTIGTLKQSTALGDSNPGKIGASVGGVGFNVSLAYLLGVKNQHLASAHRLVSAVGDDMAGSAIVQGIQDMHQDTSGILTLQGQSSAHYNAILDSSGELIVACADMDIMENRHVIPHISSELERAQPRFIVIDCNLLESALDSILAASAQLVTKPSVIIEPTSKPKLARLSVVNRNNLKVFPYNTVLLITPTTAELEQMHTSFAEKGLFDDYDDWFPALDSLGIDGVFREKLAALGVRHSGLATLVRQGTFQQAFQLLPYIPNIIVKLGKHGCVLVKLSANVNDYKSVPTTSPHKPTALVIAKGKPHEEGKNFGVLVEYYDVPDLNKSLDIVNVTGAGDTFLGYLVASLLSQNWLVPEVESLELEWAKWESIYKAQLASGKSLQSLSAVSPAIADI